MDRRRFCQLGAAAGAAALGGCERTTDALQHVRGDFTGIAHERGHRLRDGVQAPPPTGLPTRSTRVLILGAGVAGLAAARALRQRGVDDLAVLELEDQPGGQCARRAPGWHALPLGCTLPAASG